jgi:hypothetical protein
MSTVPYLAPFAGTAGPGVAGSEVATNRKLASKEAATKKNITTGKAPPSSTSGKNVTSALKLKSGETDAVGQTKTAANAGTRIKIERYGTLKKDKSIPGQSHHLNQDAAYKNVIPKDEGLAIKLKGNILTQKNSPHYKAHKSLEEFWNRFREGGVREHEVPTNREYTKALYKSLQDAGISRDQAFEAVKAAIRQRRDFGLTGGMEVPAVPKKIHGL